MSRKDLLGMPRPLETRYGRLVFMGLVTMLYVVALFVSVAIHEIVGHGISAWALGGDVYAVFVSPGSGFVSFFMGESPDLGILAFIYMAGILVQILTGILVLYLLLPRAKTFLTGMSALILAVGLLVPSSEYLFTGYFYPSGDTRSAVALLGIKPDLFIVAGLMLTGLFVILLSVRALTLAGRFLDLGDEAARTRFLMFFWFPPIVINGMSPLALPLVSPQQSAVYGLASAAILLMFLALAIYLVPQFTEPVRLLSPRLTPARLGAVAVALLLLVGIWLGAFGVSETQAHGILLHTPPAEVESAYSDYAVGNADIYVYANGTARVDLILRNRMRDPSPLDDRIYHTFDTRPYWEDYVDRSRSMLIAMFDLPRGAGENITFSTGFGTVRALGVEDDLGRRCTAYIDLGGGGTRQGGYWKFQPGMGLGGSDDTVLEFHDPWYNRGGYLDEVRITWDHGLEMLSYQASNDHDQSIDFNRGSLLDNTIGWKNIAADSAPTYYKLTFGPASETPA